ncbi:phage tail tape measure protein [Bacillus licheniformis]|uniref:phage tail tape measure protein n=1 Tax=Bacillus licheniformis TaxID=1402 RepID=UPI000925C20D|nr:phage tail tape measure protein [Bacillus licheniformis]OJT57284.1 phage tail tape measure protein [Bacillus licheniformis]OJT70074.1 phage tail tape measure protein [Bacillus licheniformis]
MPKGSNDLNMLLKAKVVKLKVELDAKGSKLHSQVDRISKMLEKKPVKLKVKLLASASDINKQIRDLSNTVAKSKSFKPIKLQVEMDVKGSAKKIRKQLKEVNDAVSDFNRKYNQQLRQMQQTQKKVKETQANNSVNIPTNAGVQNFNNIKRYVNQISEAERQLRSKFADKKGLFSTVQLKDAQGNLHGFIATLQRANGVIEKVRYNWNKDKNKFEVIDRQTGTQTEKVVHKAMQSLQDLQREINKTGKASKDLKQEYKELEKAGNSGTLTTDAVKAFKTRIKNAQEEVRTQKELNNLRREEVKLIRDIKNTTKNTGTKFTSETQDLLKQTRNAGDLEAYRNIRVELGRLSDKVKEYKQTQKEANAVDKQRENALRQLTRYLRETHETEGALSRDNIKATQQLAQRATTTKQMAEVQKRLNSMYRQQQSNKDIESREKALGKLKTTMQEWARIMSYNGETIERRFQQIRRNVGSNLAQIEAEVSKYSKKIATAQNKATVDTLNRAANSIVSGNGFRHSKMLNLVNEGDISKIKDYLATTQKLDIATAKLATNSKGVTRITTTLASTGKTAKQVTYEIDQLNRKLRQVGTSEVFNRNANLGIFEQLRVAMERVPIWMTAMTAFYGTINSVRAMTSEILRLDAALTELKRVASANISIDTMFRGALTLSKELGNNVHDVMQAVNEFARTYGDFNERQLLAITKTVTLMSNVSDLTAQEATQSLVGTMNAFNISASESIHIVDALNEVDNNYAISTKQLAEAMSRSSSTARTFGVTLEENVGNITAIGAVTMESGSIIGNSLKTIYSRITTLSEAEDVLNGVGVSIRKQSGDVREANDVLSDLAEKWNDLSDQERQNIAVKIAGRYQLSRFLALMNNWQMAVEATTTAVNSEGSAMRENDRYLESFEARINTLKNSFTELAQAVGDAVLSGSIVTVVSGLTQLAEAGVKVVNAFGVLPTTMLAVWAVLNKMKYLDGFKGALVGMFESMQTAFRSAETGATRFGTAMNRASAVAGAGMTGLRARAVGMATTVTTSLRGMVVAVKTFSATFKAALASTLVGGAFVAIGYAIEKLIGHFEKQKKKQEEIEKLNNKMVTSYRKHADGMQALISKYETLSRNTNRTKKEQAEYEKVTKDLAEQIPTTVSYIDANGKAHLKTADAIKVEIEHVKMLSQEKAKVQEAKFTENMEKQAKSLDEVNNKLKDLNKTRKQLIEEDGTTQLTTDYVSASGNYSTFTEKIKDNTKAIQANNVEILKYESEKTEIIKKNIKSIQDQTLAYFEANGQLENLTDDTQATIEKFIQANDAILRFSDDFDQAYTGLYSLGQDVGNVFVEAFNKLSQGIGDNPEKLKEVKDQLGQVAKAIPQTFYSLTDANGNLIRTQDEVVNGLKEIFNVSTQVANGASADAIPQLTRRLEAAGLSADEASALLSNLAREGNNVAIRAQLASEGIDGTTESLAEMNKEAIEAIDLTSSLFGYGSSDLSSMKSHLQNLKLLIDLYGSAAKNTDEWKESTQALSDRLNVTETEVGQNIDKYLSLVDALGKVNWSNLEAGQSYKDLIKDADNLTASQKALVTEYFNTNGAKDIITGANREIKKTTDELGESAKNTNQKIEDLFYVKKPDTSNLELVKGSLDYIGNDAEKLKIRIQEILDKLSTAGGSPWLDGLLSKVTTTNGQVDITEQNLRTLQNILNTPGVSIYLNGIHKDLGLTTEKTNQAKSSLGGLKSQLNTDTGSSVFSSYNNEVSTAEKNTKDFSSALGTAKTSISSSFNESTKPIKDQLETMKSASSVLNTTAESGNKAATSVQTVITTSGGLANVNDTMGAVGNKSVTAKESVDKLNDSIKKLGKGFSTDEVTKSINQIGSTVGDIKGKVNSFANAIKKINSNAKVTTIINYSVSLMALASVLNKTQSLANKTANAQKKIVSAFKQVVSNTKNYSSSMSQANSYVASSFSKLSSKIASLIEAMIKAYKKNANATKSMADTTNKSLKRIIVDFDKASKQVVSKVTNMADKMHSKFKSGTNSIVKTASGLPKRIGDAVEKNMSQASKSMDAVAKDMVRRFKKELGIHSPSRVFTELGGWVIKGLANGLTGEDLKSLGKNVFDDFGGGVYDSWDMIKAYLSGDFSNVAGNAGAGVQQWAGVATKALMMTGQYSEANLQRLLYQMQTESGGNVKAINLWDSNAKRGIPSKGLMQVIDPTFKAYAMKGYDTNIYDPLSNILASIRYAVSRYGSLAKAYRGVGYEVGGFIDKEHLAMVGEGNKREVVIPLEQHRSRAISLWTEAGQFLGIDPSLIDMLKANAKRGRGGISFGGEASFGATSGEVGGSESGGGDSGSSGIMRESIYSGLRTLDGGYEFIDLASKYSSKSKSNPYEGRSEAFTYNKYEREASAIDSNLKVLETRLNAMNKSTLKYRDALKQIITLQNKHLSVLKKDLSTTEKRQKTIEKELRKLPKVSKQTTKQRERYNNLMQEYDSNISKIQSLKSEIESEIYEIKDKSLEIFSDFINEIVSKYDAAIEKIKAKVEDTEFKIDVMTLVNPNDKKGLLNAQADKAKQLQAQQATAKNKVDSLQSQYDKVGKSKGYGSAQAKAVKEQLDQAKKDYKDYTLAILNAEKDIRDTRESIADEGIKTLKDYYSTMKDIATSAIDAEKEALEKAHNEKMKMYDAEIEKINSVYDQKLSKIDEENEAKQYQEELDSKNAKKAELVNKISLLSRDTSKAGKKKVADLMKELEDIDKEIASFQKDRQDKLLKDALEKQRQDQIDAVNKEKEEETDKHDKAIDDLDAKKEEIQKQYDDLINNDERWAKMRDDAIKGSFNTISSELDKMKKNLDDMNKGVFDGVYKGFSNLSEEVKKQIAELNALTVDNLIFNSKEPISDVKEAQGAKSYKMTDGKVQSSAGTKIATPKQTTPAKTTPKKTTTTKKATTTKKKTTPAKKTPKVGGKVKVTGKDAKAYVDSYGSKVKPWSAQAKAAGVSYGASLYMVNSKNGYGALSKTKSINGAIAWVKLKDLTGLRTGGYTGDWAGDGGKVALLHKKEQVFNKDDTKNLLDASKLLRSMKNNLPQIGKANISGKLATAGSINSTSISYGDINITVQGGDKKKAKEISQELLKELKKNGGR